MRALFSDRYGPADNLRFVDVPKPQPGPGEVLVRVTAASINAWDWDRLIGNSMARVTEPFGPRHKIPGSDVAGVVEALGETVDGFVLGDAVFGDLSGGRWGAFAEYVCAPVGALARMPEGLSFVDAAALPQAGALALQGVRWKGGNLEGHSVLINGAGGGVGTFAVQMAKRAGATVTAVDRTEKRDRLLALGVDDFIDYQTTDFTARAMTYDLIVDVIAERSARRFARAMRKGGRLVVIGGTIGSLLSVAGLGSLVGRMQGKQLGLLIYSLSPNDFAELARQCIEGELQSVIDSVFPFDQTIEAYNRFGSGLAVGKVVVSMAS